MHESEQEITFKGLFVPLTARKAIAYIIFIGFIVYFNSLFNGFVGDDFGQIVDNYVIHSPANIPIFFTSSTFQLGNGITGIYYKPLLLTAYSIIYSIFGLTSFFFHFFQLIMHMVNTALVFILFKKFIKKELAFFLSIMFLVHPVNQDTAAYISNYQDAMYFLFGMLALLFSASKTSKHINLKVFLMLILSLLSKETGIAFVIINIIYIFLFRKERLKKTVLFSLLIIIPYGIIHYCVVGMNFVTPHEYHISRLPLLGRMINVPKIVAYYLLTFIYPKNLSVNYDWIITSINFSSFYQPLIEILLFWGSLLFMGSILMARNLIRFRFYIFFLLWFLTGLSFHLQLIPLGGTVSPRWFYLPIVGLLGVTGLILQTFLNHNRAKSVLRILLIFTILLLSLRTVIRNTNFKDNVTLTCHDANLTGDNAALESSCGASLFRAGLIDEAQKHLELSIKLAPYTQSNWYSLGTLLGAKAEMKKDKKLLEQAENYLKKAIKNDPNIPWAYENLGYLYTTYKDAKTARNFLTPAVKKFPFNFKLWLNLAVVEYKSGNNRYALQAINQAQKINPADADAAKLYSSIELRIKN